MMHRDDLFAIRRRVPDVPRKDMSLAEKDRADLLAEIERLRRPVGRALALADCWERSRPGEDLTPDEADTLNRAGIMLRNTLDPQSTTDTEQRNP